MGGHKTIDLWKRAGEAFLCGSSQRIEALLDRPDAEEAIRLLDPGLFAVSVARLGLEESIELLAMSTPEQRDAHLAVTAWKRNEPRFDILDRWLETLWDLDPLLAARAFLDWSYPLQVLYLKVRLEVMDVADDPEVDFEGWLTPDRLFLVRPRETPPPGAEALTEPVPLSKINLIALVDHLYSVDLQDAARILKATVQELTGNLLLESVVDRDGLLKSLGWPGYEESLALYRAPQLHGPDARSRPGLVPAGRLSPSTAMEALAEAMQRGGERVSKEFTFSLNALLRFDDVNLDDAESIADTLRDGLGYLVIGLETLARDPAEAAETLLRLGPREVIRSGFSATWAPVAAAKRRRKHEPLHGMDTEMRERIDALLSVRPKFVEKIGDRHRRRGFLSTEEILTTLAALETPASGLA